VGLKGCRNLCFIETEADLINVSFYSEDRVNVKFLDEKDLSRLRLIDGTVFGHSEYNDAKIYDKKEITKI
jgi:hypothetical protein